MGFTSLAGQMIYRPRGMWDANPPGGTSRLPSSDEQSGWWDKGTNLLDDLEVSSCAGFPKQAEVGVRAVAFGWDGFLLQALHAVSSLYSLPKLEI